MKTKKLNTAKLCSKTSAAYISIGLFTIAVCTGYNLKAQDNTAYGTDALKRVTTGDRNAAFGYRSLYSNTEGWNNTASGYSALYSNTTGSRNTASGHSALYSNTEGWNNTASGYSALYSNTTGYRNTASSHSALYSNTTGWNNTASGYSALYSNTTGYRNTASGHSALYSNTTGSNNTALGFYADVAKGDLTNATAIGANATVSESNAIQLGNDSVTKVYAGVGKNATLIAGGLQVTGGAPAVGKVLTSDAIGAASWQTPIPSWSLTGNAGTVDSTNFIGTIDNMPFNIRVNNQKAARIDHLKSNTFYGYQSGNANTTGNNNTVVGHKAFSTNTTGQWNTAVGSETLLSNTTGYFNSASGYQALYSNTTGFNNTADGYVALYKNTSGTGNTANGSSALASNTTGANNTALGQSADVGSGNLNNATAIGAKAKVSESNAIQLGDNAVTKVFAGVGNTATVIAGGLQITGGMPAAGKVLTADANGVATWQIVNLGNNWSQTGNNGTIDGTNFIGTKDDVPFNIRVKNQQAGKIDHLKSNTFYGYQSGNVTTGFYNTAHGTDALYTNTNGKHNNANGFRALYYNTTGENNTATGSQSLYVNTTGSNNTAIGFNADVSVGNLDNATAIGYDAKVNDNNKVVIGNRNVTVIGGYANWTNLSDARFKKNIQKDVHGLDFIMQLKPITYNLDIQKLNSFLGVEERNKNTKQTQAIAAKETIRYNGFLAQEVEQAAAAVQYNFSGVVKPANAKDHYSMSYSDFVVPLVKGMQEQEQKIEAQEKTNEQLKNQVEAQQKINQQLQQQIDELKKLIVGNNSPTKDVVNKQVGTANTDDITLYPNPTTGICTITASNINNGVIEIYDMAGNSMQKTAFNNAKSGYQLNVSGYAKGVYLLNIIANNKKYTKRLVIQ